MNKIDLDKWGPRVLCICIGITAGAYGWVSTVYDWTAQAIEYSCGGY